MKVSKKIIELAEEIKKYRTDEKAVRELAVKKESLEKLNNELEKNIKILKFDSVEKNELREQIKVLEENNKGLKLDLKNSRNAYNFIVTTPNEASNTVYGEICRELANAKKEILICSPWITYIVNELSELSNFKEEKGKKKINLKIITRLIKEDIDKGVTDLEKFRVLEESGAEIRYNNDLHAKMMIIDRTVAIISSANLTKKGMHVNYEAGVCIKGTNRGVDKVTQFFNDAWKESKPLTEQEIKNVLSNGE